jgi:hypothetical protein
MLNKRYTHAHIYRYKYSRSEASNLVSDTLKFVSSTPPIRSAVLQFL